MISVNTRNILFICGGAFDGIDKRIASRLNTKVLGYGAKEKTEMIDKTNYLKYVSPMDLKSFGLIPEIIGRLPVFTHLNPLTKDALKRILSEPKNAIIKQYKSLFKIDNIDLEFEDGVYDYIVEKAVEFNLGARGLRSICETIMLEAMFNAPSLCETEHIITLEYCKNQFEKYK
jgi:ATP-dependent Clp protease ATP-binding subunit ClpX